MRIKLYTCLWLLLLSQLALAQSKAITGQVTDLETAEPLPGVNIRIKGTSQGTVSNLNGKFSLDAAPGDVLLFTFVGYLPEEITVENQTHLEVSLVSDLKTLSEVVVVGYGTQKKSEITGAVSSVSSEEITQTPVTRIEQGLQGRVAGVQVSNASGQPGEQPTIRIRGIGTTGNADPLYIVDGVQVGGIDYLNPNDVESIDVLKDAASAAIYGSRAANGVVLITTKSGKKGQPNQVRYDGYYGVQNPWKKMPLLNAREYAIIMNEAAVNGGSNPFFTPEEVATFGEGTDWQEEVFSKNAPIIDHLISFSGAGENSTFSSSAGYFSQQGIIGEEKSEFERYSFRLNSTHQIASRLKVGNTLTYSHLNRKSVVGNDEYSGILASVINIDPLTPVYESDSSAIRSSYGPNAVRDPETGYYYAKSKWARQEIANPLAKLAVAHGDTRVDKVVGSLYGELEILKGLNFRSSLGIDYANVTVRGYIPAYELGGNVNVPTSSVSRNSDRYITWQWENVLTFERQFGNHNIGALAGTSALESNAETFFASRTGLLTTNPAQAYLNLSDDPTSARATGGASHNALFSVFGRFNYGYKEKFLLTAIVRRDGSSRFGPENRFATFPSLSLGWVFSEESFANLPWLYFGKLRASWGQNGNQEIGNYAWTSVINSGAGYTLGDAYNPIFMSGGISERVPNPMVQWETAEQTNLGMDLAFLDNRLTITTDYYIKRNKGFLLVAPIPGIVGNRPPFVNGGEILNRGFEFSLQYRDNLGEELEYNLGLNFSTNYNEVVTIDNPEGLILGAGYNGRNITRIQEGLPIGYFYGYRTAGIFQTAEEVANYTNAEGELLQPNAVPGDVKFVDINNDGKIDESNDRAIIGNPTPDFVYGINLGANWKNFDISVFLQGARGHQIFKAFRRLDLPYGNQPAMYLDRWTGPGTSNRLPRMTLNDENNNWGNVSDLYVEDGDYMRVKTFQLGYNFKSALLERASMQHARVYLSADNLLTFTRYTGFDPEVGARANSNSDIGIDRGLYPQARTFRLGVSVTF